MAVAGKLPALPPLSREELTRISYPRSGDVRPFAEIKGKAGDLLGTLLRFGRVKWSDFDSKCLFSAALMGGAAMVERYFRSMTSHLRAADGTWRPGSLLDLDLWDAELALIEQKYADLRTSADPAFQLEALSLLVKAIQRRNALFQEENLRTWETELGLRAEGSPLRAAYEAFLRTNPSYDRRIEWLRDESKARPAARAA